MSAAYGDLDASDPAARARALAALIGAGRASTPLLLNALASVDAGVRERAAQGLAEIADPSAGPALTGALADPAPRVRGRAAQGLAAIGDAGAIGALVRTLDDYPDLLHAPHTLATHLLTARGLPALSAVALLLDAPLPLTRQRAFLVLQSVVSSRVGASHWPALWQSLGAYDPNATDAAARATAAAQWRQWIAAQKP
jgi:HEAT repeat protein